MQRIFLFLALCWLLVGCKPSGGYQGVNTIIPAPLLCEQGDGEFILDASTPWYCQTAEQGEEVSKLFHLIFGDKGVKVPVSLEENLESKEAIYILTDSLLPAEGYRLHISPQRIEIAASTSVGLYYALQSIRLMLSADVERSDKDASALWKLPAATIEDSPRFGYRGMMLDVARYFIPKEMVLRMIDVASMMKINRLHFHLVDDNGWRIEIKGHPKLTEIGAWRVDREGPFSGRRNQLPGEEATYGGYYTQQDIKEIVAYAKKHHIEVIPEIEMPAHTNASLAAYPELACPVVDQPITVIPGMGATNGRIVYCAGNDKVFDFLEEVLDQVMELFPSSYVHLGGDEASKYYWERCPLCQKRMKAEKTTHVEELQSYFMSRMSRYVQSKGKQVIGWDEWTNSTIPEGAIILGWQGNGEAGYKAALQGHNFIMSPSDILYLSYYQGPQWFEPRTYFGNNTLLDVYNYEPVQATWEPEAAARLLGVQGSLWTEFLTTPEEVSYLFLPRLAALAEIAWIPQGTKRWENFLVRLDKLTERFDRMGITYSRSMFNLDHYVGVAPDRTLKVAISCIRPDVEIRFTMDGTEPTSTSNLWSDTLEVTQAQKIFAATFRDGKQMGETLKLNLDWNVATACPILQGHGHCYRLTNGLRGSLKHTDGEWAGWYDTDFSFVLDLQKKQPIHDVSVGFITNYGMGVHIPGKIRILASDDQISYTFLTERSYTHQEVFGKESIFVQDLSFPINGEEARYLRFEVTSPGKCPVNHTVPERGVWIQLDEITVR